MFAFFKTVRGKLITATFFCAAVVLFSNIVGLWTISSMNKDRSLVEQSEKLETKFMQRRIDHFAWAQEACAFLYDEHTTDLGVEADYHKCSLGKWYYGAESREAIEHVPALQSPVADLEDPHQRLHGSVLDIQEHLREGNRSQATDIFTNQTMSALQELQSLLTQGEEILEQHVIAIEAEAVARAKRKRAIMLISALAFVLVILTFGFVILRTVSAPLQRLTTMLSDVAQGEGDLTRRLDASGDDELAEVARLFNLFVEKLQRIIGDVVQRAQTLVDGLGQLQSVGSSLAASTEQMSSQSTTVASAAEESSANIGAISAAAEQMSSSVTTVATAIEEMSSSLNEVSRNCQKESEIAANANNHAKSTHELVEKLGISAKEIGKVVDVINDIAEQTNLLALNATIEAASAGEAGKGFAVVANEVKELAKQTAQATEEISRKVQEMQSSTDNSVTAIDQITGIIEEVNGISQTIVSAVEEQSATVNEVAQNVGGASSAATEIAKNVGESSKGLSEVSNNIQSVNQAATDNSTGIQQVKVRLDQLSEVSSGLGKLVGQFRV